MSVHVVAIVEPDLYLSPGERVPDGSGAWIERFGSEADAWQWILSPARSQYFAGDSDEECPFVVVDRRGVVLS